MTECPNFKALKLQGCIALRIIKCELWSESVLHGSQWGLRMLLSFRSSILSVTTIWPLWLQQLPASHPNSRARCGAKLLSELCILFSIFLTQQTSLQVPWARMGYTPRLSLQGRQRKWVSGLSVSTLGAVSARKKGEEDSYILHVHLYLITILLWQCAGFLSPKMSLFSNLKWN